MACTQFVVHARNWVAESLELVVQEEGKIGKHCPAGVRREVRIIWRAAPDVIAGIDRLHFRREVRADGGPEPITSDKQIGTLRATVAEVDLNATTVLLNALEHISEMIALTINCP